LAGSMSGRAERGARHMGRPGKKRGGPSPDEQWHLQFFQMDFKWVWCFWPEVGSTKPQKSQIKYGWKELEIRNNFSYRNFSRFEMKFELKIREASMSWISIDIYWKFLELWISMKFGQQAPCYTLLQGKINSHQKRIRNLNSTKKGNWIDFAIVQNLNFIFEFHLLI
jgi:hypothetical protein